MQKHFEPFDRVLFVNDWGIWEPCYYYALTNSFGGRHTKSDVIPYDGNENLAYQPSNNKK